jgi:hypothetical protein
MHWRHCDHCHHEFYGQEPSSCDWCGGSSHALEKKKSLPLIALAQEIAEKLQQARQAN